LLRAQLVVLRFAHENLGLLRALKLVNLVGVSALVVLFGYYRIPPPLITFALVDVLFLLSFFFNKR
jgi:hypothetical protein